MSSSRTFAPVALGATTLQHRIALAPLTRFRNVPDTQVPTDLATEYYEQRASKGGLLITEATFIAREAGGYSPAPGIYSQEQLDAWKKVTAAVHKKEGLVFAQLWALGRANHAGGGAPLLEDVKTVGPTAGLGLSDDSKPIELSLDDIKRYIGHYKQAASNANVAGFDGVEIHGANGYLIDQFLQSNSNKRTDAYGGSIENRTRFLLEAVGAAVEALGQERVGVRLSPWGTFQGMGEKNPYELFSYAVERLTATFPKLAYIHFVEPRNWAPGTADRGHLEEGLKPSNDRFRAIIRGIDPPTVGDDETFTFGEPTADKPTLVLTAGGFDAENTVPHIERTGDVVAIGRSFIANPDLPARLKNAVEFTPYDRNTFYSGGEAGPGHGYVDYPFAEELKAQA